MIDSKKAGEKYSSALCFYVLKFTLFHFKFCPYILDLLIGKIKLLPFDINLVVRISGDKMKMEMMDSLSGKGAVILNNIHSLKAKNGFHIFRDLNGKPEELGSRVFVYLKNVGVMCFRKNENVAYVSGEPVKNDLKFIVFIDGCGSISPPIILQKIQLSIYISPFFCVLRAYLLNISISQLSPGKQ